MNAEENNQVPYATLKKFESLSKESLITMIRSMQEQQNTSPSGVIHNTSSYKDFIQSLEQFVSMQDEAESSLEVIGDIKKMLDQFEQRIVKQAPLRQDLLRTKAACLNAVLDNSDISISQMDVDGNLLEYNVCFAELIMRIFGQAIDYSTPLFNQIESLSIRNRLQEHFEFCLQGQNIQLAEIVTANKKSNILNFRFYPILIKDNVVGVTLFVEDLTQKHQEESLYRLLNSAVIYANDAIVVSEVDANVSDESSIVYANKAFCNLSGYSAKEVMGSPQTILQGSMFPEDEVAKLHQALDEGVAARTEMINYRKDGTPYWVDFSTVPLKDDNEKITHWISIQRDVSDKHRAEETIREQKHYLESINRNTSEAIVCANAFGTLQFVNKAFRRSFQYDSDEIKLEGLFADEQHLDQFKSMLKQNGEISNVSFQYKRKDGTTFWGLSSFSINHYMGQKRYDGAIRDVSDIKLAEQILQEKNLALEKTNQELDRFVYSASHDLRAPLASSLGLINISRISQDDKERVLYLEMMEQSLHKMDKTIQDITDYSRNARLQIECEEIQFDIVLEDIFERLKYLKHVDDVKINTDIKGEAKFYTDKIRLYVILINLVSNAIKFQKHDKPNPRVDILIKVSDKKAEIQVRDNGKGIEACHLEKIFGMYFQAARESSGSGLGLFIVKESINKLNGSIKVKSTIDEGSCFAIELPNEQPNETQQQKNENA